MPAQWTGDVVGQMHNKKISMKDLAMELGWHDKYLSRVINSENPPSKAEGKVKAALDRIIMRQRNAVAG